MNESTKKAMTLEQVRDELRITARINARLEKSAIHAMADAIDAHLSAQSECKEAIVAYKMVKKWGYPWLPCPICKGVEGCDHAYGERAYAALAPAQREGEAIGRLVIITDDSNQYGKNARFDYTEACMDLPVGEHPVYTDPPHPRVEVTDEMVERACKYLIPSWDSYSEIDKTMHRESARNYLESALSEKGHG